MASLCTHERFAPALAPYGEADENRALAERLRARRAQLREAIFARVREVSVDPAADGDVEYLEGLRATVCAAVEYGFVAIECGGPWTLEVPPEVAAQARLAASRGLGLDTVLRRYIAGAALLWDFVVQDVTASAGVERSAWLRSLLRSHSSLVDELVATAARAYGGERRIDPGSHERRVADAVRRLLSGEVAAAEWLDYRLAGRHVAAIAIGAPCAVCEDALRAAAQRSGHQLLGVRCGESAVWGWLQGASVSAEHVQAALLAAVARPDPGREDGLPPPAVRFAIGEPATGLEGWRLTHRQAQAAASVAARGPRTVTRYGEVALLAAILRDESLARSLVAMYVEPLGGSRESGAVLRATLRAYLRSERNVSSAAALLKVARSTVANRLQTIDRLLGCPRRRWPPELEVALAIEELQS